MSVFLLISMMIVCLVKDFFYFQTEKIATNKIKEQEFEIRKLRTFLMKNGILTSKNKDAITKSDLLKHLEKLEDNDKIYVIIQDNKPYVIYNLTDMQDGVFVCK